jgi:hypothetical protein
MPAAIEVRLRYHELRAEVTALGRGFESHPPHRPHPSQAVASDLAGRLASLLVVDHALLDQVGQASLQCGHGFHRACARRQPQPVAAAR